MKRRYLKVFLSCAMVLNMVFSTVSAVSPSTFPEYVVDEIAAVYGIPRDVLLRVDQKTIHSLYERLRIAEDISTYDSYILTQKEEDGTVSVTSLTESEFVQYQQKSKSLLRDGSYVDQDNGMIKVRLTVLSINDTLSQISVAFDWIVNPSYFCNFDILNVAYAHSETSNNQDGFYQHYDSYNEEYITRDFTSADGKRHIQGFSFQIPTTYNAVEDRYAFIRTDLEPQGTASDAFEVRYLLQNDATLVKPTYRLGSDGIATVDATYHDAYSTITAYFTHIW